METFNSIGRWANSTFGNPTDGHRPLAKLVEEVGELSKAIRQNSEAIIALELADCVIVLSQIAATYDLDLQQFIDQKMTINRNRVWNVRGDGTADHIR